MPANRPPSETMPVASADLSAMFVELLAEAKALAIGVQELDARVIKLAEDMAKLQSLVEGSSEAERLPTRITMLESTLARQSDELRAIKADEKERDKERRSAWLGIAAAILSAVAGAVFTATRGG